MLIQWSRPVSILMAWWIVDLHQWLPVTADVCSIHSAQDNFPRGDTGALSHSASVSTVLLDWGRHKYLMSPQASTTLKMQHRVRHKVFSSLRSGLLWVGCDQLSQKQNTGVRLKNCANNSYNHTPLQSPRLQLRNKKLPEETFCTLHIYMWLMDLDLHIDIDRHVKLSKFSFVVHLLCKDKLGHEETGLRPSMTVCGRGYTYQYPCTNLA